MERPIKEITQILDAHLEKIRLRGSQADITVFSTDLELYHQELTRHGLYTVYANRLNIYLREKQERDALL